MKNDELKVQYYLPSNPLTETDEEKIEKKKAILNWLGPDTFKAKHDENYKSGVEKTFEWFFQCNDYQSWLTDSINPLYCHGKHIFL